MKKILSYVLIVIMVALSCLGSGCLFNEMDYDVLNINIAISEDSIEKDYYIGASQRFEEYAEDTIYFDLYKGVDVDVILCQDLQSYLLEQDYFGYDIFVTTPDMDPYVRNYVNKGYVLGLDDVFLNTSDIIGDSAISIEEKIHPTALSAYKSDDFEYYALPNTSEIVGLFFDVNAFNRYGYFFAEDKSNAESFYSELTKETYYFTIPTNDSNLFTDNKTAGVDLTFGTEDDGLPRTLNEFVALCEYIKSFDRYPFICAGGELYKADYLVQALTYSLMGVEEARACMNLDGKIQVVTGFTNKPLFPGLSKEYGEIFKPTVEMVELTEKTGYYASWSLAKYYAEAFMELSLNFGWWAPCSKNSNINAVEAYKEFIYSGYDGQKQEALMLLESSNWFNKVNEEGIINKFNALYNFDHRSDRIINVMSMPTLFDGKEEYAINRTKQTFQQVHPTYLLLANQVGTSASKTEGCKDFLKFLCTEQECNYYTVSTGIRKDLSYNFTLLDLSEISYYHSALEKVVSSSDIVYLASNSSTFKKSPYYFEGGKNDSRYFYYERVIDEDEVTGEVIKNYYTTCHQYFRDFNKPTTKFCFKNKLYTKETWKNVYGGYGEIGEYINSNGKPVVFNG